MGNVAPSKPYADDGIGPDESGVNDRRSEKIVRDMDPKFARVPSISFPGHSARMAEELGTAKTLTPKFLLKRVKTYVVLSRPQHQKQKQKRRGGTKHSKINPMVSTLGPDWELDEERREEQEDSEEEQQEQKRPKESIKIMMTKQELAQMIANGSILVVGSKAAYDLTTMSTSVKIPNLSYSSMRLFNHPQQSNSASVVKRSWYPQLESIVEVPSQ